MVSFPSSAKKSPGSTKAYPVTANEYPGSTKAYPASGGGGGTTELIEKLTLATDAYGNSFSNQSLLRQDLLRLADGSWRFAYHAENLPSLQSGKLTLGSISSGGSVTTDVSSITTTAWDSHNFFALHEDGDGDVLLSGDMHGVAMNFARLPAGDINIAAWATPPIQPGATDEASVTYPMWGAPLASGNAVYFYRDGGSGDGNLTLKRWNKASNAFDVAGVIVNGNGTSTSFYPNVFFINADGTEIDISGTWRNTPDLNTNHDVIFLRLKTTDGWATWTAEKVDGSSQTLPVTVANAEYVAVTGTNVGLTNVGSQKRDAAGNPQIFTFMDPGNGITQLVAWR